MYIVQSQIGMVTDSTFHLIVESQSHTFSKTDVHRVQNNTKSVCFVGCMLHANNVRAMDPLILKPAENSVILLRPFQLN